MFLLFGYEPRASSAAPLETTANPTQIHEHPTASSSVLLKQLNTNPRASLLETTQHTDHDHNQHSIVVFNFNAKTPKALQRTTRRHRRHKDDGRRRLYGALSNCKSKATGGENIIMMVKAVHLAATTSTSTVRKLRQRILLRTLLLLFLIRHDMSNAFQSTIPTTTKTTTVSPLSKIKSPCQHDLVCRHPRMLHSSVLSSKRGNDDGDDDGDVISRTATDMSSASSDDDDNDKKSFPVNDKSPNNDPELLLADFFAIFLACQLMGLLDVVNDPSFEQAGGWLQPITAMPATLGILVQRVATLGILWIVSTTVTASSISSISVGDGDKTDVAFLTAREWQPLAVFAILRIGLEFASTTLLLSSSSSLEVLLGSTDWIVTSLRDAYFAALFIVSLRFLYKTYFWY